MTQHSEFPFERWVQFTCDQQILMIAAEMNRASKLFAPENDARLRNAFERILQLTDLTIRAQTAYGFRRELLRWRDLIAAQYVMQVPDSVSHREAFRVLLRFTPEAARQIPHLVATRSTVPEDS